MRPRLPVRRDLAVAALAILGLLSSAVLLPAVAQACPVCFGEADSKQARGLQVAVLVLGGVLGILVAGIAGVVLTIRRRSGRREP